MRKLAKIISYSQAKRVAQQLKKEGKKIVFKTGCFDIVHIGHIRALAYCKKQGDILIVGIGSDETLRTLKGPERPIFPQAERAEFIASLGIVDYVVILNEPLVGTIDHQKIISLIKPNFYMLPQDDKSLALKRKLARQHNIKIKLQKFVVKNSNLDMPTSTTYIRSVIDKLN